jgi:hypothetical protein
MADDMVEMVYGALKDELNTVQQQVVIAQQTERALFSDSCPSYTVATLPTLANGGLGNGTSYVTYAFASNGRKAAEGAGLGTGQLVYYNAVTDQWLRIRDDSVITA